MSALPPKYCPECGDEFVHVAQRCGDCDVDLVAEPPPPQAERGLPSAAELVALVRGGPWELERIAHALADEGIPSRIDNDPPDGGTALAVFVLADSLERARRALEDLRAREMPDAPAAAERGESLEGCPACGAALADDAAECPDCGLPFAEAR